MMRDKEVIEGREGSILIFKWKRIRPTWKEAIRLRTSEPSGLFALGMRCASRITPLSSRPLALDIEASHYASIAFNINARFSTSARI